MGKKLLVLAGMFLFFQFGFSFHCVPMKSYEIKNGKLNYGGRVLKEVDVTTFEVLDAHFGKDEKNIYYKGHKVLNVDAATFSIVKTKEYNGYCNFDVKRKIPGNLKIQIIEEFKDKNGIYKLEELKSEFRKTK